MGKLAETEPTSRWDVYFLPPICGDMAMPSENAIRRERLFELFTRQPGHEEMTRGEYFFCPICRNPFGRDALGADNLRLSLAHIIPDVLGGTWTTLTCVTCNNEKGGRDLEADLVESLRLGDWLEGIGPIRVRIGDEGRVRAELRRFPAENRLAFTITTPMANPATADLKRRGDEIQRKASGSLRFRLRFPLYRARRCWAAVCQSAYLLLFGQFGYDFARHPTYSRLREQIIRPDEHLLDGNIFVLGENAAQILNGSQGAVMFVNEPVRALLAVLRFRSPGKLEQVLGVMLPGPGDPDLPCLDLKRFSGAIVPYEPDLMSEQAGYLWMRWHMWRKENEQGAS
jgi:hypothetical protein